MSTPSIPGVDRDALADAILRDALRNRWMPASSADAVLTYIAAHHKCACDREHADEWVEVGGLHDLPTGARIRSEWVQGETTTSYRRFIHRDDMPDDPHALIAREFGPAKADTFLGLLDEHGWTVTRKEEQ